MGIHWSALARYIKWVPTTDVLWRTDKSYMIVCKMIVSQELKQWSCTSRGLHIDYKQTCETHRHVQVKLLLMACLWTCSEIDRAQCKQILSSQLQARNIGFRKQQYRTLSKLQRCLSLIRLCAYAGWSVLPVLFACA